MLLGIFGRRRRHTQQIAQSWRRATSLTTMEESYNEEKKDDSDLSEQQAGDAASYEQGKGASSTAGISRATGDKQRPPRCIPSFYSARFSEHFFPSDEGGNASPKKLSIFQRYAMSMVCC